MGDDLEDLLRILVEQSEEFRDTQLGLYLHGSESRGEAGAESDIDVLGLCEDTAADDVHARFKSKSATIEHPLAARLDFKVIAAHVFAKDPWVDLDRARWLGGHPWHRELPTPTPDERGRESLLVLAVNFEDRSFADSLVTEVRKPVGRLCSVLAQLTGEEVPISGNDARRMLSERTDEPYVSSLLAVADDLDQADSVVDPPLSRRIQTAADQVASVLADRLKTGGLGPRCAPAAAHTLEMWQASRRADEALKR